MAEDLRRWLNDEPIQARPISPIERLYRRCRRRPALATTSAIAIVLVLVVGMVLARHTRTSGELKKQTAGRADAEARQEETAEELSAVQTRLRDSQARLEAALAELDEAKSGLAEAKRSLSAAATDAEREDAQARIAAAEARLDDAEDGLREAKESRDQAENKLDEADTQPEDQLEPLRSFPDTTRPREVQEQSQTLEDALNGSEPIQELLPGLLQRPDKLKGIGRWQMETVSPRSAAGALVWHPNGKSIALGTFLGTICRYNAATMQRFAIWAGHSGDITSLAWNPNGTRLVSASVDNTLRLWMPDGTPGPVLHGHSASVLCVDWRPDGSGFASGGADSTIRLWNEEGTTLTVLKNHAAEVNCVAWSPEGSCLASGSSDGTIRLWTATGKEEQSISVNGEPVTCLDWSADGTTLVCASESGTIRVFDKKSIGEGTFKSYPGTAKSVALSPDGQWLASAGIDKSLRLWPTRNLNAPITSLATRYSVSFALAWSPDGLSLAEAMGTGMGRWLLADTSRRIDVPQDLPYLSASSWSFDGRLIAIGSSSSITLWQPNGKRGIAIPQKGISGLAWSPNAPLLASTHVDNTVQIWKADGSRRTILEGHSAKVVSVSWSPDGNRLVSGSLDKTVRIWDPASGASSVLKGHADGVLSVDWGLNGLIASAGGMDKTVRLWMPDGAPGHVLIGHEENVTSVKWSPKGDYLASGSRDETLRIWTHDGNLERQINTGHPVDSVTWSPDGRQVAVSGEWEVSILSEEGNLEHELKGYGTSKIKSVEWSPDGRWILMVEGVGCFKLWDARTGNLVWNGMVFGDGRSVAFEPTGRFVHGELSTIESRFIYLVEQASGRTDILRPSEFTRLVSGKLDASVDSQ